MALEKKQARAVQDATGLPYLRCLQWVRANHEPIRERIHALHAEHGLSMAAKIAAAELALKEFPPAAEEGRDT